METLGCVFLHGYSLGVYNSTNVHLLWVMASCEEKKNKKKKERKRKKKGGGGGGWRGGGGVILGTGRCSTLQVLTSSVAKGSS